MAVETALSYALQMASRGWHVFPIQPGTKYPYPDFPWRSASTNDPEKIKLAAAHPRYLNCNWALDCGRSNVTVLDSDIKERNGEVINGEAALAQLPELLPPTLLIETPSGGLHRYYTGIAGTTSASKLGPGLDTRSEGGYVLLPGSTNGNGRPYKVIDPREPAPVPEWVRDMLTPAAPKPILEAQSSAIPIVEPDLDHNVALATEWLRAAAPEAHQGAGGDQVTFQVAAGLKDRGISADMALILMAEHWNDTKAFPPWNLSELQRKVHNAYKYGRFEPGSKSAEATFPNPLLEGKAIRNAAACRIESLPKRKWLLGNRYLREYITLTIAPGDIGKSLLVIAEGLAVASGKELTGMSLWDARGAGAGVWLYNTEDPFDELERRVMAAAKHYKLSREDLNKFWYSSGYEFPFKVAVSDPKTGRAEICENVVASIIKAIKERDIKLFVVDPFVECHGVSENSNVDMSVVMQVFRRIAGETGCAISLVHHTTKGKEGRGTQDKARGASSMVNAARIAHTLYPMDDKEARMAGVKENERFFYIKLDSAKANLSPPGVKSAGKWFKKVSVKLGGDELGEVETTGVVEPVDIDTTGGSRVTVAEEDFVIRDAVVNRLTAGNSDSVYKLSEYIEELGVVPLAFRQIQRRLEAAFEHSVVTPDGRVLVLIERKGPSGRMTKHICCHKDGLTDV